MDFASNLPCFASDADAADSALGLHSNDIVVETRSGGITTRPNTVLRYAIKFGLSEAAAIDPAALLERHNRPGQAP